MNRSQVNLRNALRTVLDDKQSVVDEVPGLLGAYTAQGQLVSVPDRADFCYARLRGNDSEVVQAYNDTTIRRFNWPVKLVWQNGRWEVLGRNSGGSPGGFGGDPGLANHARQHMFYGGTGTNDNRGDDIVWVNKRQWMPLNLTPTHPFSMQARVWPDYYMWAGAYNWYPGSDTVNLSALVPQTPYARFVTVYLDASEALQYVTGSLFEYSGTIYDPEPVVAIPPAGSGIVLGAVLLYEANTDIDWNDIWDMRSAVQGYCDPGTGSHPAVTLSADADITFLLNGQEIGIEAQGPNEFWGVPTGTVGIAVPIWRTIEKDDLPWFSGTVIIGDLTAQNVTISSLTANTAIYSNASKQIVSLANAAGYLTNNGAGTLSWSVNTTPSVHNVLDSTYHGDVLTGAITRGDILYGNATPKVARLAKGTSGAVLTGDGTDTAWSGYYLAGTALQTYTFGSTGGTIPTAAGTLTVATTNAISAAGVITHAITSSSNPGAAASILASSAAGMLTLNQLTIPATTSATVGVVYLAANRFIHAYGTNNLFFGVIAGNFTLSATYDVGIGYASLNSITTGSYNVGLGYFTLVDNQTGTRNMAIGYRALKACLNSDNMAIGNQTLETATDAHDNTAIGSFAVNLLTTGYNNVGIGTSALRKSTDASNSIGIGCSALYNEVSGFRNLAIGFESLYTTVNGYHNVALGYKAGYTTTTNANVFLGPFAGYYETGAATLFIDNDQRTNEATARIQAMMYGVFNTTIASQILTINAVTKAQMYSADTNAVRSIVEIHVNSTGTPANGFGGALDWYLHSSTTVNQKAASIKALWNDATHLSRKVDLVLSAYDTVEREFMRGGASGTAATLSFYGGTKVVRGAALTAQLTTITHTAPGTPDYAIQDFVNVALGAGWAFANHDEANSALAVITNLQTRVAELEARLGSVTGINVFA